eukprot:COSAG02_NODE_745_length_17738_cov_18.178241_2_plen_78_part_00
MFAKCRQEEATFDRMQFLRALERYKYVAAEEEACGPPDISGFRQCQVYPFISIENSICIYFYLYFNPSAEEASLSIT